MGTSCAAGWSREQGEGLSLSLLEGLLGPWAVQRQPGRCGNEVQRQLRVDEQAGHLKMRR